GGSFFSIKNIRESLRNGIEGDKSQIREWFGENTLTQMGNGAITTLHGVADLALVTFDALLDYRFKSTGNIPYLEINNT
ncbi:hypothetical protein, partial [Paenibacillus tengchongensis]|uniref:hypothetical protein n=1 Tax=Paenibacillus tengchongensis TaxID=2608684 RepID=UPI001C9E5C83